MERCLNKAKCLAAQNRFKSNAEESGNVPKDELNKLKDIYTVLFMDEANTTEAIGLIKEIMCDRSVNGVPFDEPNLKIVAACNPYRK